MQPPGTVRLIRIFVSSPGDVAKERAVLDEAIQRINETQGQIHGVQLVLWKWEQQVVPQVGPRPQTVVDAQTQAYDIYLGNRMLSTEIDRNFQRLLNPGMRFDRCPG